MFFSFVSFLEMSPDLFVDGAEYKWSVSVSTSSYPGHGILRGGAALCQRQAVQEDFEKEASESEARTGGKDSQREACKFG